MNGIETDNVKTSVSNDIHHQTLNPWSLHYVHLFNFPECLRPSCRLERSGLYIRYHHTTVTPDRISVEPPCFPPLFLPWYLSFPSFLQAKIEGLHHYLRQSIPMTTTRNVLMSMVLFSRTGLLCKCLSALQ